MGGWTEYDIVVQVHDSCLSLVRLKTVTNDMLSYLAENI